MKKGRAPACLGYMGIYQKNLGVQSYLCGTLDFEEASKMRSWAPGGEAQGVLSYQRVKGIFDSPDIGGLYCPILWGFWWTTVRIPIKPPV